MARLISILAILGIALSCILAEELYSDQYDDIDPMSILSNEKLRMQYYNCFMGTETCKTPDAKFFKEIFGDAIVTKCKRCTEKQKEHMDMIVNWYTKNSPEQWQRVVEKSIEDMKKKNTEQ